MKKFVKSLFDFVFHIFFWTLYPNLLLLYFLHSESISLRSDSGMNWTSEKKTYPRLIAASPAKTMSRRRVSSSASRKFWEDKCCSRTSKGVVGVGVGVGVVEGVVVGVVEETEKVMRL